ncbi:MAG: efflux RND transporter periplasmic adaptor subunit [Acidimicrobiales bacterium]
MTSTTRRTRSITSKNRLLVSLTAIVLVGVVVVALVVGLGGSGAGRYVLATARIGSVTTTVEVSGTIEPTTVWGLNFGGAGIVATVSVTPGQQVVAGQILAQLNTTALAYQLDQAQATLQGAQDKLNQDSSGPTSPLPSVLAADQAAIAGANAAVASAQQQLNAASIVAPGSGVVASVGISPGQAIANSGGAGGAAGAASANGPSGAIVVNGSQGFLVSAQVADTQVAQVHPGQSALITPAGASGSLPGQVSSVAPQGATTQGVVVFPVDIAVSGNPPGLFAGASAQVSIIVSQATGVLTVPTSSVHTVGARNFVFVLDQGKPTRQIVQLGPSDPTRTSVTSGLRAGTPVVLASSRATVPSPNGIKKKGGGAAGLLGGGGGGGGGKRGLRG